MRVDLNLIYLKVANNVFNNSLNMVNNKKKKNSKIVTILTPPERPRHISQSDWNYRYVQFWHFQKIPVEELPQVSAEQSNILKIRNHWQTMYTIVVHKIIYTEVNFKQKLKPFFPLEH